MSACSDDKPRRPDSELIAAPPAAPVPASEPSVSVADAAPAGPLTGAGRRYRVAVGTAYFFDQPQQATPSGKYLRRGDVFYGEGEHNGFVKTGFVGPNGARSTGWLKRQELSVLAAGPASASARRTPTPPADAPPTDTPEPRGTIAGGSAPQPPAPGSARRAVVQAARAYFYNTPDLATPRKAHCVRGDNVRLGEERGAAVYVTFTNWERVTTTGWMRKAALAPAQ